MLKPEGWEFTRATWWWAKQITRDKGLGSGRVWKDEGPWGIMGVGMTGPARSQSARVIEVTTGTLLSSSALWVSRERMWATVSTSTGHWTTRMQVARQLCASSSFGGHPGQYQSIGTAAKWAGGKLSCHCCVGFAHLQDPWERVYNTL